MNTRPRTGFASTREFERLAGMAGLGFLVLVVIENLLRGVAPLGDAELIRVFEYYNAKRVPLMIAHGLFFLSLPLFLTYIAGLRERLSLNPASQIPAFIGWGAGNLVAVTFGFVVVFDLASTALASSLSSAPLVMLALFKLHGAAFLLNGAVLGVAMIAFGLAAARSLTEPKWLANAAMVGGVLLLLAAVPAVPVVDGSLWGLLGLLGFLCWLLWVGVTSVRMIRP